jgi:mono/diheme cytochrome c family protein
MAAVTAWSQPAAVSGADLFAANCTSCHGRYGDGEGRAADVAAVIPDLRYLAARNGGAFPRALVADIIDGRKIVAAHGNRMMPVWGDAFVRLGAASGSSAPSAEAKIAALVDYLAEIQLQD